MSREAQVRAIFDDWEESFEAMSASFDVLTDDCLLVQAGMPDCRGAKEIQALLKGARDAGRFERVRVEVKRIVEAGDTVVSERIDWLLDKEGQAVGPAIPVLGIMDFQGDKIAAWREYFDTSPKRATS